jgi:hypothetical protein
MRKMKINLCKFFYLKFNFYRDFFSQLHGLFLGLRSLQIDLNREPERIQIQ